MGSNHRHKDFQSFALPTELSGQISQRIICKNEDNVINQSNDLNPSAFA